MSRHHTTPKELVKFYQSAKWKKTRAYIRQRDQGICQECGAVGREVHHKEALTLHNYQDTIAIDPDNLVLLCRECHMKQRGQPLIRHDVMFDEQGRMVAKPAGQRATETE